MVLLTTPSLAVEFLIKVQNVPRIKKGRIALIQVNPMDMLTYDALRAWQYFLSEAPPTLDAGLSLILMTALPTGSKYDADSFLYKEVFHLQSPLRFISNCWNIFIQKSLLII